jgi:Xaa-Pro aminopeptidase
MKRLREVMEKNGWEGFLVTQPINVNYVSHYTGVDSYLLFTRSKKYFLTDPRYTEQASKECPDYEIFEWRPFGSLGKAVAHLADQEGLSNLAYEASHLTVSQYRMMEADIRAELVPTEGVIEEFRSVKSPEEIHCLKAACEIASRAFEQILKEIRVGVTEKELAAKLSLFMVMEGADTQPYGNILISGARTSLLHGIPSEKAVEYGDLVLMDYGCQYHGYLSDMTRTVVVGRATSRQREVYALEQKMVQSVEDFLKDGVSAADAYSESTKVIEGTEYFPYHYTGIGHGVGMFVHEVPFMGPKSGDMVRENNVMTVEPGIYIPGWGGIRIEDQGLIRKDGFENLISAPKELIEL